MPEPSTITAQIDEIAANFQRLHALTPVIAEAGVMLVEAVAKGGKIMFCGNGGSAADCQHLAAELTGRYLKERAPIAAIALTVDTSALTAIGNDYAFDKVFSRQIAALARAGDVLVGISTSGRSGNVIEAFKTAKLRGVRTIALTGEGGGDLAGMADCAIRVPSAMTNRIQEMHIAVGHMLCGIVEEATLS